MWVPAFVGGSMGGVGQTTGDPARRSFVARRVAAGLTKDGYAFGGEIGATRYARSLFCAGPVFTGSAATSRVESSTPNLPQIGGEVPDERRVFALRIEVVGPRVVRLRLGERADDRLGVLVEPEPPGLPLTVEAGADGARWVLQGGE